MTSDLAAVVAKVLDAHVQGFAGLCACGWKSRLDPFRPGPEYRAHVAAEVTNALTTGAVLVDRDTLDQWIEDALTQGIAPASYIFGVLSAAIPEALGGEVSQ